MSKRNFRGVLILCLLAAVFVIGLIQIFNIRLVSGRLYPAWSSLRPDPDGTRVLFDALAGTGRFETVRKYKALKQSPERNATVLFLGYSPASLARASNAELDEFEQAARSGDRIVIAMDPDRSFFRPNQPNDTALTKRWGVSIERMPTLFFDKAEGWMRDAGASGRAVAIERAFDSGSIVLVAYSDVFANQNLATKRDSALLMHFIGANTRVVFDESHLGVQDTGSVLGLVHKYRMDGALWGLLAVAIVFIWSHAAGFPPPDAEAPQTVAGHDAHAALAQLLRRHIPVTGIVEACVSQSAAGSRVPLPVPQQTDPVAAYRALQQELTRK
jgi:hypothetical protein